MATARIDLIQGTTDSRDILLIDAEGLLLPSEDLVGASAEFLLRETAGGANVLQFTTVDTVHLSLSSAASKLTLTFLPTDTSGLTLGTYVYQVMLTLANGGVYPVLEWSPLFLTLGGASEPEPPVFANTVALNHDFGQTDALRFMTPGGSPIPNAQIRVYYKANYDAGQFTAPVGVSQTNAYGRWQNPVMVLVGYTYTIQFLKPNEYGPNTIEVTVPAL